MSLVYLGFKNLRIELDLKPSQQKSDISFALDADWDNDGLANREESFWNTDPNNPDTDGDGYLDGEEVASGHDPLKPSPDDLLLMGSDINITDRVSTLLVSGFYAGDLSENADPDIYNKAVTDISNAMITDSLQALDPSNISTGKIVTSSDSKDAQEKYLNAIGYIIQEELWGHLINEPAVATKKLSNFGAEDPQMITDSQIFFNTKAAYYKGILEKMSEIPVPPSWLDIQQLITDVLRQLVLSHQSLAQTDEDPVKSPAALSTLMSLYRDMRPILTTIVQRTEEKNLNRPAGALWSLIVSLSNEK